MIIANSMKQRFKQGQRAEGRGQKRKSRASQVVPGLGKRFFVLACCLLSTNSFADDWPFTRGDAQGSGVAQSKVSDSPELLWKYESKESAFEATPVVSKGIVYVGDADGTIHAIRLGDGEKVWTRLFEETGFVSGGAVLDGYFYVGDYDGVIYALSIKDGEPRWKFETESETYAGPILFEDQLLVTTEGGTLFSIDLSTGQENWRFTIEAPLRCAATISAGHTLLAGCDGKLHAIDLKTGKETGAVDIGGQTGNTAAIAGDYAYFGNEGGVFTAVKTKDPTDMQVAWTYRDPRRGQGIRTVAAVGDALVVYGSNGKAIYGLNPADGQPIWEQPVRSRVESSPVIADNRVLAATTRGRLLLLNAADGETLWEYDAGGSFISSPAVIDGRIVIGNTDGTLYCFGEKD